MAFRSSSQNEQVPASPELLFRELPRSPGAASSLWVHQGDVLREYSTQYKDERVLDESPKVVADPLQVEREWWASLWSPDCVPSGVPL